MRGIVILCASLEGISSFSSVTWPAQAVGGFVNALTGKTITIQKDCDIQKEKLFHLVSRMQMSMQILVQILMAQTITIDVMAPALIDNVKARVPHEEDIPPDRQRSLSEGDQLKDGRISLAYDIQKEYSTDNIQGFPFSIHSPKDPIQDKEDIQPDQLHLAFADKLIDDGRIFLHMTSVQKKFILQVVLRFGEICIEAIGLDI